MILRTHIMENTMKKQELEEKRTQLLKQLSSTRTEDSDSIGTGNSKELRQLKKKYNEVIGQQIEMQRGELLDPLDTLPSELWIEIFQYYLYSSVLSKPMQAIFRLTLVSDKWRNAIVRTPELWTKITVGRGLQDPDFRVKLHICLYLSGTSPLTLFIEDRTAHWDAIIPLFLPHIGRIRAIIFQKCSYPSMYDGEDARLFTSPEIVISFGSLPGLQYIDVRQGHGLGKKKNKIFPENTPSITFARGTYLPVSALRHRNLRGICGFTCESPLDVVIPYIIHLPSLRYLNLGSRRTSKKAEQVPPKLILPVDWPVFPLITFTYQQPPYEHSTTSISRLADLVELTINSSWERLGGLLSALHSLHNLGELTLRIMDPEGSPISRFTPENTQQALTIKQLEIGFKQFANQESHALQLGNFCRLFLALQICATSVQGLMINDWERVDMAVDYIKSLPDLKQLRLHPTHRRTEGDIPPLQLNSMHLLNLSFSPSAISKLLSTLQASKLTKLILDGEGINGGTAKATLELDDARYPMLESIKWPSDGLTWKFASLNSLVQVHFRETCPVTAGDFCVYLTYRPHDFPALRSITFGSQPEWDCIMMMLERRNFLFDKSVTAITSLSFPSRINPYFRHPISDLLRGCFTQRPLNHDISLAGISDTYFDETIPGCHLCHTSLQNCKAELISVLESRPWLGRKCSEYLAEVVPDPPLSDDLVSWIKRRQDRHDLWSALEREWPHQNRTTSCDPLYRSYTYIVTGFSMTGLNVDSVIEREEL